METNRPLQPTLEGLKGAFSRGLPVNKPDGQSEFDSKQWWKLATVARDQTGIDFTIDHSQGHPVIHPER